MILTENLLKAPNSGFTNSPKKPNPHLLGFETNLETLNRFIIDKKERLITKKEEAMSDFRLNTSQMDEHEKKLPRPKSSTNNY